MLNKLISISQCLRTANSRHRVDKLLALMAFSGLKNQPDSDETYQGLHPLVKNDPEMKQTRQDAEMSNLTISCCCNLLCEALCYKNTINWPSEGPLLKKSIK